jgi:hypothetical protein
MNNNYDVYAMLLFIYEYIYIYILVILVRCFLNNEYIVRNLETRCIFQYILVAKHIALPRIKVHQNKKVTFLFRRKECSIFPCYLIILPLV